MRFTIECSKVKLQHEKLFFRYWKPLSEVGLIKVADIDSCGETDRDSTDGDSAV